MKNTILLNKKIIIFYIKYIIIIKLYNKFIELLFKYNALMILENINNIKKYSIMTIKLYIILMNILIYY